MCVCVCEHTCPFVKKCTSNPQIRLTDSIANNPSRYYHFVWCIKKRRSRSRRRINFVFDKHPKIPIIKLITWNAFNGFWNFIVIFESFRLFTDWLPQWESPSEHSINQNLKIYIIFRYFMKITMRQLCLSLQMDCTITIKKKFNKSNVCEIEHFFFFLME